MFRCAKCGPGPPEGPSSWAPGQRILARSVRTPAPGNAVRGLSSKAGIGECLSFSHSTSAPKAVAPSSGRLRSGCSTSPRSAASPTNPSAQHGSLHWDILRLWHEMKRAASSCVSRSPRQRRRRRLGLRLRAARRARRICSKPVSLPRPAHRRHHGRGLRRTSPRNASTRSPASSSCPSTRCTSCTPQPHRRRGCSTPPPRFVTIPDLLNYWLTGGLCAEFTNATTTQMVDARTRNWATRLLRELGLPTRLLPADRRARRRGRRRARNRLALARRARPSSRRPATTPDRRSRRCTDGGRRSSARAPGRCSAPRCRRR